MMWNTAWNLTREKHPELFGERDLAGRNVNERLEKARAVSRFQDKIKVRIQAKLDAGKAASHTQAWRQVYQDEPELFTEFDDVPLKRKEHLSGCFCANTR
jgi:hypothetical protein